MGRERETVRSLQLPKVPAAKPGPRFSLESFAPAAQARGELGGIAERLASQFYAELDELWELGEVITVGATSCPERIDPAVRRPGRFGFTIRFALPYASQREEILAVHLSRLALEDDVRLAEMAGEMEGFSGADIAGVCQRAVLAEMAAFVDRHGHTADEAARAGGFRLTRSALWHALERHRHADHS